MATTRAHSMLPMLPMLPMLVLGLAALGCDATPVDPTSGLVIMDAVVDARRASSTTAALRAPLPIQADDPHGYTALLARAGQAFGADATRVIVRDLSLVLEDGAWTTGLDDLFAGDIEVRFQPGGGGASHLVALIPRARVQRAGAAVVVDDATFDSDALTEDARAAILAGDFEVTVHGPAGPAFAAQRDSLQAAVLVVFEVHP